MDTTATARQYLATAYARRLLGDLAGAAEALTRAGVERAHIARAPRCSQCPGRVTEGHFVDDQGRPVCLECALPETCIHAVPLAEDCAACRLLTGDQD